MGRTVEKKMINNTKGLAGIKRDLRTGVTSLSEIQGTPSAPGLTIAPPIRL